MRQKSETRQNAVIKSIKDIRRVTRKQYSAEEKPELYWVAYLGALNMASWCDQVFIKIDSNEFPDQHVAMIDQFGADLNLANAAPFDWSASL